MNKHLKMLLLSTISLAGCTSSDPFELSQQGPTMKDNYKQHVNGFEERQDSKIVFVQGVSDVHANDSTYDRLPNPDLKLFIYPHRSEEDGVIIPGYYVSFPMYKQVHYSVFGE